MIQITLVTATTALMPVSFHMMLRQAREKRPKVTAETQRHNREPNSDYSNSRRGGTDPFPHSVMLVRSDATSAAIHPYISV
jgi:hypothetical protein